MARYQFSACTVFCSSADCRRRLGTQTGVQTSKGKRERSGCRASWSSNGVIFPGDQQITVGIARFLWVQLYGHLRCLTIISSRRPLDCGDDVATARTIFVWIYDLCQCSEQFLSVCGLLYGQHCSQVCKCLLPSFSYRPPTLLFDLIFGSFGGSMHAFYVGNLGGCTPSSAAASGPSHTP